MLPTHPPVRHTVALYRVSTAEQGHRGLGLEARQISARAKAALAVAKARGTILGGDRGYRPSAGPDGAAAARVRQEGAERAAQRLALEIEALRAEGISTLAGVAKGLMARGVQTPCGGANWTRTTVARVLARLACDRHPPSAFNR